MYVNKQKKLNTATLSGLIIGPVLGSGVILLPPLLFNTIGNYSLLVWIIISLLGFAFALVFGRLAILFPGDGGVSLATKAALGKKYQLLTSFYLIFAVLFGPVAVLLVAAQFLQDFFIGVNPVYIALGVYLLTYFMLLVRIDFLGKLMLIVTSTITIIFLVSSLITLLDIEHFSFNLPQLADGEIGHAFLLAFWALVGWEVIGNYSNDIEDSTTLTKSVIFSAIMVAIVYLLLGAAISFGDFNQSKNLTEPFKLVWLIEKLFGNYASYAALFLAVISTALCIGTLILFVGGVARLVSSLKLHPYLSTHLSSGSPIGALNILGLIHLVMLVLVYLDVLDISMLVGFANGFFIANAIIGLVTAMVLFENGILRYSALILAILFFAILAFSNIFIIIAVISLFLFVYFEPIKSIKKGGGG